jgi:8-oxo-dGTP diphosphatase
MRRKEYYHQPDAPSATTVVPCVFAVVTDQQGRVLLVRRVDSGNWEMPGGAVDPGESTADALRREVREESGLIVVPGQVAGVFCDPGHVLAYPGGQVRQQLVVCMRATVIGGVLRPDWYEVDAADWVPPERLDALPIHPSVRARLRDALPRDALPVG